MQSKHTFLTSSLMCSSAAVSKFEQCDGIQKHVNNLIQRYHVQCPYYKSLIFQTDKFLKCDTCSKRIHDVNGFFECANEECFLIDCLDCQRKKEQENHLVESDCGFVDYFCSDVCLFDDENTHGDESSLSYDDTIEQNN